MKTPNTPPLHIIILPDGRKYVGRAANNRESRQLVISGSLRLVSTDDGKSHFEQTPESDVRILYPQNIEMSIISPKHPIRAEYTKAIEKFFTKPSNRPSKTEGDDDAPSK